VNGWVKLRRDLAEEEIWKSGGFDAGKALVDLLMRVTFRSHISDGKRFRAGCVYTSTGTLAERWGWSYDKVRWFLKKMEAEKRLKVKQWPEGPGVEIYVIGWNPGEEQHHKPTVKPRKTEAQHQEHQGSHQHFSTVEPSKTDIEHQGLHHLHNTQVPVREEPERSITGGRLGVSPEGEPPRPVEEDPLDAMIAQWEASRCTN
jgi:hypothetical protein